MYQLSDFGLDIVERIPIQMEATECDFKVAVDRDAYESSANFRAGMEPFFYSDGTQFTVTLPNLNYHANTHQVAIDVAIDKLKVTDSTKAKIRLVFSHIGYDVAFGRKEVAEIIGISQTAAGNLINKLKTADMVEPVSGLGKGKYRFRK